jgi:hypothetical protein
MRERREGGTTFGRRWRGERRGLQLGVILAGVLWSANAHAGMTFKIDDTRSFSAGIGARGSFSAVEKAAEARGKWSKDFNLDNARIYLSGQIFDWLKLEVNTECAFCGNGDLQEFVLLDGIFKIEPSPYFNIWGGRLLVPAERREMDGPFYGNVYENFKTPFYPADFSVKFGSGGAGVYGRDHGVNLWGDLNKLKYVFGVFSGLRGGPNTADNLLYATRIAYQFLDVEDNPGYYTSSTYYGGAEVLTLAWALQYQKNGAGSKENRGDFLGTSVDLLFEKPLGSAGVITAEADFKYFDFNNNVAAYADPDNFGMFDGEAYTGTLLYLFPEKVGPGKFQPYGRFTQINADGSQDRNELEFGLNYIISGHNAKVALFYQYGDLATKSLVNFAPGVTGDRVSAIKLGIQLQI